MYDTPMYQCSFWISGVHKKYHVEIPTKETALAFMDRAQKEPGVTPNLCVDPQGKVIWSK